MNLNLNGLPEDGNDEVIITPPAGMINSDPMSIWGSKSLLPESLSPDILATEDATVTTSSVDSTLPSWSVLESIFEEENTRVEAEESAADAFMEFINAIVDILQSEVGTQDLKKVQTGKWEEIPLSDTSSLFIRFNDEKQETVEHEYDLFEGLTEEELDSPCPGCGLPMRNHME